ncbi:MAG: hypothetical protein ACYS8I_13835, partial [Planctomycetota bacterium]
AAEDNNIISLAGYSVDNTKFHGCALTGVMTGFIQATMCDLQILSGVDGKFRQCGLSSTLTVATGADLIFASCFSEVAGNSTPIIDVNGASSISFRNYSGGIQVNECHDPTTMSIDLDPGHLVIDATCDGGQILVRGHGHLTDNHDQAASPSLVLVKRGMMDGFDLVEVRQMIIGDADTSEDDRTVTIWDEDGRTGNTKQLEYDVSADKRQRTRTL